MELHRCDGTDSNFVALVNALDLELRDRDGDLNEFYHQYNGLDDIHHAIVLYRDGKPAAIGAFKPWDAKAVEIKRMYTLPEARGNGFAYKVLADLEKWARELSYNRSILETGKGQPEAIALYKKAGYTITENYGQYAGVDNSVCFSKDL